MEGFDMRAVMPRYQLSNLLLYKHELLLSKCPLTADWLLIRPLWNEISNEPLNYGSNTEHIISCTYALSFSVSVPFTFSAPSAYLCLFVCFLTYDFFTWSFSLFFPAVCNCSGRSENCVFDMEQYRSTGSGGRCVSCRDNTDGPHCERCRANHYRKSAEEPCLPCNCNINGNLQKQKNF